LRAITAAGWSSAAASRRPLDRLRSDGCNLGTVGDEIGVVDTVRRVVGARDRTGG